MAVSTPKNILDRMQRAERLFVLGCNEQRVTLRSQQIRALNLIYSLIASGKLAAGSSLACIGGGVSGLTAAVAAATHGCSATILERQNDILTMFQGNMTRWLHPHIYDWPSWSNCFTLLT